jgi:hypothetical protein
VTKTALALTDSDGTINTFDRVQTSPSDNRYIDTYTAGQDDITNILDASFGAIEEPYRGTHQYFRDEMIGVIISALAAQSRHQVVASIKKALEHRKGAELRKYCDWYITTFPDDPFEFSVGEVVSIGTTVKTLCRRVRAQQRATS